MKKPDDDDSGSAEGSAKGESHRDVLYGSYVSGFKGANHGIASSAHWLWRLRGWLPAKDRPLLEVGCGQGLLLATLRQAGFSDTFGVDLSQEQIDAAVPEAGPIACRDALKYLAETTITFDTVIAIDVLEHLSKEEAIEFLRAVGSCATGSLIIQVPNAAAPRGMYHQAGDLTHQTMFSPTSMRQLVLAAGFGEPEFREVVPVPTGIKGRIRNALWKGLRRVYQVADIIELGGPSAICSRNMLVRVPILPTTSTTTGSR